MLGNSIERVLVTMLKSGKRIPPILASVSWPGDGLVSFSLR